MGNKTLSSITSVTSTIPKEPENRGTTGTEARLSSCEDVNCAVEREEEKVLVKYATRATLPGMSRVIETGEETFVCGKRKLSFCIFISTSKLLVRDVLGLHE